MDLTNKVAVVTGAARGIGAGLVRACLAEGMRVAMSDADGERLAETAGELLAAGARVMAHPCDVRELRQVEELRDAAARQFGSVDLICNKRRRRGGATGGGVWRQRVEPAPRCERCRAWPTASRPSCPS